VDVITVKHQSHVVEKQPFKVFERRWELLVGCPAGNLANKFLVRGKLLFNGNLAVVKFFLSVILSTEHILASLDRIL
jgi:hypothetical protein